MMEQENHDTYLILLEASLKKKCGILDQLIKLTSEQENLINEEITDDQRFNEILEEKEQLIQMLLKLDDGFEQIYQRVKEELSQKKYGHLEEINRLKELIAEITDKSIQLQAMERRNKAKLDNYLMTKRKDIKKFNVNSKSAASYYKNMTSNQNQQDSYFFDKKK